MIGAGNYDGRRVRIVAHHDIDDEMVGRIGTITRSENLVGCYVQFDDEPDDMIGLCWNERVWLEFIDEKPDNKPLPLPG